MVVLFALATILLVFSATQIILLIKGIDLHLQILSIAIVAYAHIAITGRILTQFGLLGNAPAWLCMEVVFFFIAASIAQRRFQAPFSFPPLHFRTITNSIRLKISHLPAIHINTSSLTIALLVVAILLLASVTFVAMIFIPQNADDVLTAYLPRIGYWIQAGTVDHFVSSTYNSPQSSYPINGHLPILRSIVLSNSYLFAGLDQWLSGILSSIALFGLARSVKGSRGTSFFLAGIWFLSPSVALQLGIALTDLLATFLFLTALLFAIKGWNTQNLPLLFLSSLALALAVGTKHTILFTAPALALLSFIPLLSRGQRRRTALLWAGFSVPIFLFLGIDRYMQNWRFFGHPFGEPDSFSLFTGSQVVTLGARISYLIENSQRTIFNMFFGDIGFLPHQIEKPLIALVQDRAPFVGRNISTYAGVPWFGTAGSTLLALGLIFTFYQIVFRQRWLLFVILLPGVSYLMTLYLIRPSFSLAFSRYTLIPIALALAASATGLTYRGSPKGVKSTLVGLFGLAIVVGSFAQTSFALTTNGIRPLTGGGSAWGRSSIEMLDLANGFHISSRGRFGSALRFINECTEDSSIGIEYGNKFPQSLIFSTNPDRKVTQFEPSSARALDLFLNTDLDVLIAYTSSVIVWQEETNFLTNSNYALLPFGDLYVIAESRAIISECNEKAFNTHIIESAIDSRFFENVPAGSLLVVGLDSLLPTSFENPLFNPLALLDVELIADMPSPMHTCGDYQQCTSDGHQIYILRKIFLNGAASLLLAPVAEDRGLPNNPLIVMSDTKMFGSTGETPNCDMSIPDPWKVSTTGGSWLQQSCVGAPAMLSTYEHWLSYGCTSELRGWYICTD